MRPHHGAVGEGRANYPGEDPPDEMRSRAPHDSYGIAHLEEEPLGVPQLLGKVEIPVESAVKVDAKVFDLGRVVYWSSVDRDFCLRGLMVLLQGEEHGNHLPRAEQQAVVPAPSYGLVPCRLHLLDGRVVGLS